MKNKYYSIRKLNKIKNLKGEILLGLKKVMLNIKILVNYISQKFFIIKLKLGKSIIKQL